ncbi:MAG: putative hydrolase of the HAD superfamily [Halobacteriales archaeon]|jgi:putative hydrolase of the HAD superfamily
MTTAVFFDLDGTVLEYTRPYGQILAETLEDRLGRSSDELVELADRTFSEAFEALEPDPYLEAVEAVAAEVDREAEAPALVASLVEHELEATTVPEGARDLFELLAERHRVGILSNGVTDVQETKLEYHDLDDLFDPVVVSYDVGAHKPDPEIFAAARDAVDADAYVMIGDDYGGDVEAAREAGFEAIHFDRSLRAPVSTSDFGALAATLDVL